MKHAFWAYFLIIAGIAFITIMLLLQRMSTISEEDFYLGREVMEAAMIDAVDYGTYRTSGKLVMSEQKFVEVFLRRFAESVTNTKTYEISFYDIYEEPPKASVKVRTKTGSANINNDALDITLDTLMTGILETIYGRDGDQSNAVKYATVKRYISCTQNMGLRYDSSIKEYVDFEVVPGSLVTIKYDENTFSNQTDGINSECKYNIYNADEYSSNDLHCKVNYRGKVIYVKRGDLTVSDPSCNVTKITYDDNGGSGCSDKETSANKGSDWRDLCTPTRACYTFAGWFTSKSGGTQVKKGDIANSSATLYAHWNPAPCTLTYNSYSGSACNPGSVTKNGGQKWGTLCTPSRSGYTFNGWYDNPSSGNSVTANSTVTSNITVYAHWTQNKVKLTYYNNGGSGCSLKEVNQNEKWGDLCVPSRSGYTFNGWYTSTSGGTKVTKDTTASSNLNVYAQWTGNCSETSLEGCELVHTCRSGKTFIYNSVSGVLGVTRFSSTISDKVKLYKVGPVVNGMQKVYLANGAKIDPHAYYDDYIPEMNWGYVDAHCLAAVGVSCSSSVCTG